MPQYCYFIEHGEKKGEMLGVRKGDHGYFRTGKIRTAEQVEDLNSEMGVTKTDLAAMLVCSMIGNWEEFDKIGTEFTDMIGRAKDDKVTA